MVSESFSYWVEIPEGVPFKFGELAFLIADALHPTEFAAAAASINLESELISMVDSGALKVRDGLTMGLHPFPVGDALRNAVLFPHELRPLLESRGIGLHLKPHGSGPERWTIENATRAIGDREGWHQGARDSLVDRMSEAAGSGALVLLDPHTDLPHKPRAVRTYFDLVATSEVDGWLERSGVPYRLRPPAEGAPSLPMTTAIAEGADSRCARLLKEFREEQVKQSRGALARVVSRDGRARQTVSADIKKARKIEALGAGSFDAMARLVRK